MIAEQCEYAKCHRLAYLNCQIVCYEYFLKYKCTEFWLHIRHCIWSTEGGDRTSSPSRSWLSWGEILINTVSSTAWQTVWHAHSPQWKAQQLRGLGLLWECPRNFREAVSVLRSEQGGGRCGAGVLSMHTEHGENAWRGLWLIQGPEKEPCGINWGAYGDRTQGYPRSHRSGCAGPAGLSVFIPKAVGSLWCVSSTGKSWGKSPL